MKKPYFLILTACSSIGNVYADPPKLPPVLDNSSYSNPNPAIVVPVQSPADASSLIKIQAEIAELKAKVQAQEELLNRMQRPNAELLKKAPVAEKVLPTEVTSAPPLPALEATVPAAAAKVAAVTDKEKELYKHASEVLKKGNYALAITEFQNLLKTYPEGKYADKAQYWTAVALLNKGDKKAAIPAFDLVARNYPKSDKAPEALVKLADTLLSMKNKPKAKEYFDYVIQNYPGSNGAKLAAKKKAAAKL